MGGRGEELGDGEVGHRWLGRAVVVSPLSLVWLRLARFYNAFAQDGGHGGGDELKLIQWRVVVQQGAEGGVGTAIAIQLRVVYMREVRRATDQQTVQAERRARPPCMCRARGEPTGA